MRLPMLILGLLLTASFGLAAWLGDLAAHRRGGREASGLVAAVMGESRRLLANHLFVQADVYFHDGYYPSVFDQVDLNEGEHMLAAAAGVDHDHEHAAEDDHEHEHVEGAGEGTHEHGPECQHEQVAGGFLGLPLDWIDRFGRHFYPSTHVHAEGEQARELLPWLRLAADLDPQNVATYTVAAFWLRSQLGKVDEAEQFLREGWRENPDSPEILLELGRVFYENRKDVARARNVWELAARKWQQQEAGKPEPDVFLWQRIAAHLAELEEHAGNHARAADWFERVEPFSPHPERIRGFIEELRRKAAGAP